ncbi:MAG TPA: hypothetical protein VK978_02960 [Candidatus Saccharimonadales bacterium]|nr:hypothetical protein [Candidatus Saccharimonadales bacterium]
MADTSPDDDIYNDPATIGDTTDDVSGQPDIQPTASPGDPSQSIYNPEKNTTQLDDRGPIDELEVADMHDTNDAMDDIDPALHDDQPSSQDGDDYKLSREEPADERDDTFNP